MEGPRVVIIDAASEQHRQCQLWFPGCLPSSAAQLINNLAIIRSGSVARNTLHSRNVPTGVRRLCKSNIMQKIQIFSTHKVAGCTDTGGADDSSGDNRCWARGGGEEPAGAGGAGAVPPRHPRPRADHQTAAAAETPTAAAAAETAAGAAASGGREASPGQQRRPKTRLHSRSQSFIILL